jgi:hypothetical protein
MRSVGCANVFGLEDYPKVGVRWLPIRQERAVRLLYGGPCLSPSSDCLPVRSHGARLPDDDDLENAGAYR